MQKVDRYFMFPETNAKCVEDRSVTDYAKKQITVRYPHTSVLF